MGSINKTPLLFQPKPLFGLDIGKGTIKVVQLSHDASKKPMLEAYGYTTFDAAAVKDGVIDDYETIAAAIKDLFSKKLVGAISTRRVALTIPSYRTFTRTVRLPLLKKRELAEAVRLEAEQYIPMPLQDMHLDYTIVATYPDGYEVLLIAVPRQMISSYLNLAQIVDLEVMLIESTMNANSRLFAKDPQSDVPSVIIDFGTYSADISIYDGDIITTGTVEGGGQVFTEAISKALNITLSEAMVVKSKYGLSRSRRQTEIQTALQPSLQKMYTEIKRLLRYHDERYSEDRKIKQIAILGGGANMPGLSDALTSNLRLATRAIDTWQSIDIGRLQPPSNQDKPMYSSAIGVSLAPQKDLFS